MGAITREPVSDFSLVVGWLACLWAVFAAQVALAAAAHISLASLLGLRPLEWWGLIGIPCAPFLHANIQHLTANSISLLILGWLSCAYSRRLTAIAVGYSIIYSGVLTWVIGNIGHDQPTVHIGASGVAFGLIGFLVANGLFRRSFVALLIAVAVGVLCVGALPAMLPNQPGSNVQPISWQMHLGGFIGGITASWQVRKKRG